MSRPVPDPARKLAAQLAALFAQDAALARRLNAAHKRLQSANHRLWWRLHPHGLAVVYGENPAAVDVAFAEHRSEVLGAPDPLAAIHHVHRSIAGAFIAYQTAAEERRQLAAKIGELIRQLVDALVAAGRTEKEARNANAHELAITRPTTRGGTDDGNDPHTALRNGKRAPRPGDGGTRPGKPHPPTPSIH